MEGGPSPFQTGHRHGYSVQYHRIMEQLHVASGCNSFGKSKSTPGGVVLFQSGAIQQLRASDGGFDVFYHTPCNPVPFRSETHCSKLHQIRNKGLI